MAKNLTTAFTQKLQTAETPATVDAVFADIAALAPTTRARVLKGIDASLEQEFTANFDSSLLGELKAEIAAQDVLADNPLADLLKDNPLAGLLGSLLGEDDEFGSPAAATKAAPEEMTLAQTFLNLHKAEGAKAGSRVKTFAAEAAKLGDEEYGTRLGQMKLLAAVMEQTLDAAPKPAPARNPFRANP